MLMRSSLGALRTCKNVRLFVPVAGGCARGVIVTMTCPNQKVCQPRNTRVHTGGLSSPSLYSRRLASLPRLIPSSAPTHRFSSARALAAATMDPTETENEQHLPEASAIRCVIPDLLEGNWIIIPGPSTRLLSSQYLISVLDPTHLDCPSCAWVQHR